MHLDGSFQRFRTRIFAAFGKQARKEAFFQFYNSALIGRVSTTGTFYVSLLEKGGGGYAV